ncbi:hypothetical protein ACIQ9E_04305 [Streptomyces sp. NPDC094448]|uniref:hypothetical protein n=1 Tax=Streptomyces sp. NPDC094448 TaxID=3366063 RepID=UPI00382B5DE8
MAAPAGARVSALVLPASPLVADCIDGDTGSSTAPPAPSRTDVTPLVRTAPRADGPGPVPLAGTATRSRSAEAGATMSSACTVPGGGTRKSARLITAFTG